jgi:hypothetical protein
VTTASWQGPEGLAAAGEGWSPNHRSLSMIWAIGIKLPWRDSRYMGTGIGSNQEDSALQPFRLDGGEIDLGHRVSSSKHTESR